MKYLIPLLLISTSAIAQQTKPCEESQKIYNFLIDNYGEKPFVEMKETTGRKLVIFVNPQTGSWTVITTDDKIACGISSGKEFTPADPNRYKKEDPS